MLFLSIVVFTICLTNIQCSEEDEEHKLEVKKGPEAQKHDDNGEIGPTAYDIDIVKTSEIFEDDKNKLTAKGKKPGSLEPGFDLTPEEMSKFKIWPNGIIPYYIDDISFDNRFRERLRNLLTEFNHITSLSFTELSAPPKDENERWVLFINRRGALACEDYTTKDFTSSGVQRVVLGYDCLGSGGGALAGMVLAMAGIPPQHNSPDRDDYITVVMDNIIPEKRDLFQKLQNSDWLFHDIPYDFISAGHYNLHQYSINGSATIIPKRKEYIHYSIGERDGISPKDIWKIKMLYNFISLTRRKAKASDCSQIFKLGSRFDRFRDTQKSKEDNIKPRHKPNKYSKLYYSENFLGDISKAKKELGSMEDFNTDSDNNIHTKLKVQKMKARRPTKIKLLSNIKMLSDFDTDA
ncbi:astacin (Peptidase family m12A) domain-containing protein [Phthorimaea operculella]|nr:astacin (Peptidase family m12A) domain-containing protein [Phthorimaea operculella]